MPASLQALRQRVDELERLADEVSRLAEEFRDGQNVQAELSRKGQEWYRAAREFLVQQQFSGLREFDACYDSSQDDEALRRDGRRIRSFADIGSYIEKPTDPTGKAWSNEADAKSYFVGFSRFFRKARSLVASVVGEVASRALPLQSQLSLAVAAEELDKAEEMLANWGSQEVMLRASGVVARIALERHLFTFADTKGVVITVNPPTKPKPGAEDALVSLQRAQVITPIQKSRLDGLFKIGNACAHPGDPVTYEDVKRLIRDGREIASVLV